MKYTCMLISVADINAAKKFYEDLFGLEVFQDYGRNIAFTCGLALQQDFDWLVDLPKERVLRKSNNVEIVFEEQDFDGFLNKLKKYPDIEYLGEVIEHSWGATGDSVLRFGRSYRRGWRGYENGAKAFSCFQHDNGRNLCENGRFRGGLNKTYEQLNFRKKKMVLWNLIKTTAISKWKK